MKVLTPNLPEGKGEIQFDGFGIGGSFTKDDIGTAVK